MSPLRVSRPSMTMPSVVVMPTRRPMSLRMWAIIRTVVVLPLVPVTPMIGMRAFEPTGNSRSMTGLATYCGSPSVGLVCIRNPGAALTSTMAPPCSRMGTPMSGTTMSMPAMSRPTTCAAVSAISMFSGWVSIVRSMAVPPVDMLPVSASWTRVPASGTESSVKPCFAMSSRAASSSLIRVSTFSWPKPRRGSLFSMSTSSRTVCVPSASTPAGTRSAMATIRPPMISARWSAPWTYVSTTTSPPRLSRSATGNAFRTSSSERRSRQTPRPWLPSSGLTTTG